MKAAQAYAAASSTNDSTGNNAASVPEEVLEQITDDTAMDVDGGPSDKRKRKVEGEATRRVNPEPTKKKAKAGKLNT
jgi:hypothetical protein